MRKIVLSFGLIAGALLSVMLLLTLPFLNRIGLGRACLVGLPFTLVGAGVLSRRRRSEGPAVA